MKKLAITATSSAAIVCALTSSVWAGGLAEALTESAVPAPATAALCAPSRSLDVRGGALKADNVWADEAVSRNTDDKVGLGDAEGGFADLAYSWDRCSSDLTIGAGFASTDMDEDGESDIFGGEGLSISDASSITYLDVAYGRPLNESLRYFGGLRVLNFESESRYAETIEGSTFYEETLEASFTGIGPIVGISYETQNRSQGEFGFFGEASAAALFGSQRNEIERVGFSPLEAATQESDETVISYGAEIGVSYNISDNSVVKLGITYQALNDIDYVSGNTGEGPIDALETGDREYTGAFLGYHYQF